MYVRRIFYLTIRGVKWMHGLTGFQRDLLLATCGLAESEDTEYNHPHGLRIKEAVGEYYGKQINHGRLYPNLDTLVGDGYLDKYPIDDRTNGYKLTEKARRAIQDRIAWEADVVGGCV